MKTQPTTEPLSSLVLVTALVAGVALIAAAEQSNPSLWDLARKEAKTHRFSTLFTAHDVRNILSGEAGLANAIDWCKRTAVSQVYIECFRDGYQAERGALTNSIARFRAAGIGVSGCVTPTQVGKSSTGWKDTISCYTDRPTQERLRAIFEYAASLADETMIDDFW
ncbi:MAG: hypothetical protein NTY01_03120, partial [Verrucomicrobia bacterium]|nr:hypothetical protein [Verrucomicrobiota bacterium]